LKKGPFGGQQKGDGAEVSVTGRAGTTGSGTGILFGREVDQF